MTLNITTIQTEKTESGLTLKLQEKKVGGQNTTYQVMTVRGLGDAGLVASGLSYGAAVDCFDWWLNGCLA
jgi:hypothetical protein